MKKIIALILVVLCLCGVLCITSTAQENENAENFKSTLDGLDCYYEYDAKYMTQTINWSLCSESEDGFEVLTIAAEEYEAILAEYFVLDESIINQLRGLTEEFCTYNSDSHTYTITCGGFFGGRMPLREYVGYVQNGDRYDVFYEEINYQYLEDVLPEGVDQFEYAESLGWPESIKYDGYVYELLMDDYICIVSYNGCGNVYTVEYNGDIVRIVSKNTFTEKDLPDSFDDEEPKVQLMDLCITPNRAGGIVNVDGKTYFSCSFTTYPAYLASNLFNEYMSGLTDLRFYIADDINNKTYVITDYFDINSIGDIMIPVGDYEIPLDANGKYSVRIEFVEAGIEDGEVFGSATSDKGVFHSTDEDFLKNGAIGDRNRYVYVTEGVLDAEYITDLFVGGVCHNNVYRDENGEKQTYFEIQLPTLTKNRVIPQSLVSTDLVWTLTFSGNDGSVNTVNVKPERQLRNVTTFFRTGHQTAENYFVPVPGVNYTIEVSVTDINGVTWSGKSEKYFMKCPADFVPAAPAEPIAKSGFFEEEGKLYYYQDGQKITGWFEDSGKTYYASRVTSAVINYNKTIGGKFYVWNDERGLVLASGFVDDGVGIKCYYEGYNVIGWHHADGSGPYVENGIFEQYSQNPKELYYFLSTTGYMVTDSTYKLGGYMREFNEDHTVKPLNGLQDYYGTLYYYADGVKQTGWHTIDGVTYYFMASDKVFGQAAQRWMYIGNKIYYFYASTSATPYALKISGSIGGIAYEYSEEGNIIYNGFINCEYANVAPDNTAANIQKKNATTRYYVDGEMQTSWQNIDGNWYYFYKIGSANGSGYMCTESRTIGGVWYEFDAEGSCSNFSCDHLVSGIINGYDATCLCPGLTNGKYCINCDKILVSQAVIHPYGHDLDDSDKCKTCGNTPDDYWGRLMEHIGDGFIFNGFEEGMVYGGNPDVIIPSKIGTYKLSKRLNDGIFMGADWVIAITIPEYYTEIGCEFALNCDALTVVSIPSTVTVIGEYAFANCPSLEIIIYNGTVTEWHAITKFNGWNKNTGDYTVYCNDGVAPKYCSHPETVFVEGIDSTCSNTGLTAGEKCTVCNEFIVAQEIIDFKPHTDGEWITEIEATKTSDGYKYQICANCGEFLRDGIIHATGSLGLLYTDNGDGTCTVSDMGDCTDSVVVIPSYHNGMRVTAIGKKAFYKQTSITSVEMSDTVTLIDAQAFQYCSSLVTITLSAKLENVGGSSGADVFGNSKALKNVYFPGTVRDWCNITFKSAKANPMNLAVNFYMINEESGVYESVTSITIPDGVTVIGSWQFYGFDNLTTLVMSDSVETVSQYAFMDCTKLSKVTFSSNLKNIYLGGFYNCGMTEINLPESLSVLGNKAFQKCTKLTSVEIPASITTIPEYAFYGCSALVTVIIPDSITTIGNYAFNTCTKLANVYYTGSADQWANITITSNQTLLALTVTYDYKG